MNIKQIKENKLKKIFQFSIPSIIAMLLQTVITITDGFFTGNYVGENALAAVGNSYEITLIFIAFAFGCNIGCSVIVSQFFGAKKFKDMKTAVMTTILFCSALCIFLMFIGLFFGDDLLHLIRTPEEIFDDSKLYLDIYVLGLPFLIFYNVSNGIFSALGDSKTPFIFLAVSSISNILVDILFVKAFGMGVAGVAWATFLCQGISALLALAVIFHRLKKIEVDGHVPCFSWNILKRILLIAIPSTLQQSFVSVGNIVIQRIINEYGASVIAGYSASVKLNNLVITSFTTLGNGISNYTAQNLGAGKYDRIKAGFKAGIKLVWALCIPFFLIFFFGNQKLLYLFLDAPTEAAIRTGTQFLCILSPFYFVISCKLVADGILRGSGMMKQFMISTFADLILRVSLAYVFSKQFGSIGIWCAWPVGWSIGTGLSLFFYKKEHH